MAKQMPVRVPRAAIEQVQQAPRLRELVWAARLQYRQPDWRIAQLLREEYVR